MLVALLSFSDPIGDWARARIARDHIPAMAVGVYRDGKPLKVAAYGTIDLARGLPARRDTEFEICSVTKQFTAVAVLLLAEAGKLSLDDPLSEYFPGRWKSITLRDALHHLTGLPDTMVGVLYGGGTREAALRKAFFTPALRPPRTRFAYNNTPYLLMMTVVERASGQPFWTFLKRRVFDPLGMRHTHPNWGTPVRGYAWRDGRYVETRKLGARVGGGAGGLLSTVDDLARWSEALRKGTLLKPASRAAMLTPGRLASGEAAWNGVSDGYGLGVFLRRVHGVLVEKHSGGWQSASASLTRLPGEGLTIVVLANRQELPERSWWGEEIAEIVTGRQLLPSFDVAPDPDPARTARVQTLAGPLTKPLRFVRAVRQGETTALTYRTENDLVMVWEHGTSLSELQTVPIPRTRVP